MIWGVILTCIGLSGPASSDPVPVVVRVPLTAQDEVDVAEVVGRLARRAGLEVERPPGELRLPVVGLAGAVTRKLLARSLGPDIEVAIRARELVFTIPPGQLMPGRLAPFER